MPFSFEFATATRIVFGAGKLADIGPLARTFGRRPFVVTGRNPARAQRLLDLLTAAGLAPATFALAHEPTTDDVTRAAAAARAAGSDHVIGFGGGSAIDAAKAVAALLTNDGPLLDYLEVVGRAQPLAHPAAPILAIPTTAGTGAEVTRNAVLSAPATGSRPPAAPAASVDAPFDPTQPSSDAGAAPAPRVKVSLRSPHLLPRLALIDPELTYELPAEITAATGLDALTQLIEPYLSSRANPLTDALCVEGLRRAARSLWMTVEEPNNAIAREAMSVASLFSGLALANAGLGAVHGLAGPIGGLFPAPHGAVCAALLPHVLRTNLAALRARAPDSEALRRFDDLGRLLTGRPSAAAEDAVLWTRQLVASLPIPPLSRHGITTADFPAIVTAAAAASSMKANPLPLTPAELTAILAAAL